MNDEQLDKILKKALTPQREIKEEEIVLKKRRKEEKMMRKKRMKMAGIAGTVAAALALACIVPQTSFAEQLKKMFQGYWGQRSEASVLAAPQKMSVEQGSEVNCLITLQEEYSVTRMNI